MKLEGPYDRGFRANKSGYAEGFCSGNKHEIILFPSARVAGKVTHGDGTPPAGAIVKFSYQGNSLVWSDAVYADDQGAYAFEDVPATGFRYSWMRSEQEEGGPTSGKIKARDRNPDSEYVAYIESFPVNARDNLTKDLVFKVKLWPVQPLKGRAVNAKGEPVQNASAYVHTYVEPSKTGVDGAFTVKTAPTDRDFQLFAMSAEKDQAGLPPLKASATEVAIPLEPTKTYDNIVIEANLTPQK